MLSLSERIGLRIHELRRARGWTQTQLAERCQGELSHGTLRDIERGRHCGPRWGSLAVLAGVLGVTVEQLLEAPMGTEMPGPGTPVRKAVV